MPVISPIHAAIRSPVRSPVVNRWASSGATSTIADQTIQFGALTLASAGGAKPLDSNGAEVDVSSVTGVSGTTSGWTASGGRIIRTTGTPAASDGAVLSCVTSLGTINVTIQSSGIVTLANGDTVSLADVYSFATLTEAQTLSATAAATVTGKTFLARPGTYTGQLQFSGKVYASRVTLSAHVPCFSDASTLALNTLRAKFTSSSAYTIEVLNTDNLTIKGIEVENTSTLQGTDDCVRVRGPLFSDAFIIEDCWIHGTYRDPNGDYSLAGAYTNPSGLSGDGNVPSNITIRRNYISDLWVGVGFGYSGYARCQDNYFARCYYDFSNWAQNAASTELTIQRNVFTQPVGVGADADDPHIDCIQGNMLTGTSPTDDWTGVVIEQNIYFRGDARGSGTQFIFFGEDGGTNYVSGPICRGNVAILNDTAHGITFEALSGGQFYNNTIVRPDPTVSSTNNPGFRLATTGSVPRIAGTQTLYGNITEILGTHASAVLVQERNVTIGAMGATIPYGNVFTGDSGGGVGFSGAVSTRTTALARFAMKPNGNADIDDSGSASLYDAGAVGSGYSTFPTNILSSTGASLNASYEAAMPTGSQFITPDGMLHSTGTRSFAVGGTYINEVA